ncbi:MAG: LytR C-terminal domain-containing protein [Nitriliruptorales bacterium]
MSDARHTPPGDRSFARSVSAHLAAGVALIAVVAGAFWGLGRIGQEPTGPIVAASPTEGDAPATTEPTSPNPQATAPATPEPGSPTPTEASSPTESPTGGEVDPASVSMQVLDATEAGTAAGGFADRARSDGYRVVAVNRAVRVYERTTVFWSPGHEEAARHVAAQYGFAVVEEKPNNLTSSVNVHVVIGEDYSG